MSALLCSKFIPTLCTNFYQNRQNFVDNMTKTLWLTFFLDTVYIPQFTSCILHSTFYQSCMVTYGAHVQLSCTTDNPNPYSACTRLHLTSWVSDSQWAQHTINLLINAGSRINAGLYLYQIVYGTDPEAFIRSFTIIFPICSVMYVTGVLLKLNQLS